MMRTNVYVNVGYYIILFGTYTTDLIWLVLELPFHGTRYICHDASYNSRLILLYKLYCIGLLS